MRGQHAAQAARRTAGTLDGIKDKATHRKSVGPLLYFSALGPRRLDIVSTALVAEAQPHATRARALVDAARFR